VAVETPAGSAAEAVAAPHTAVTPPPTTATEGDDPADLSGPTSDPTDQRENLDTGAPHDNAPIAPVPVPDPETAERPAPDAASTGEDIGPDQIPVFGSRRRSLSPPQPTPAPVSDMVDERPAIQPAAPFPATEPVPAPTAPAAGLTTPGEPPASAAAVRPDLRAMRVLAAEDNKTNQLVFSKLVKACDIELTFAGDGVEALATFESLRPDLVFMDISMPGMDGKEATRRIRELEAVKGWPHTRIVALTAHAMAGDAEKILAHGLDAHLTKPLRKPAILSEIDGARPETARAPLPQEG
jgi:hypothetical protein